jgi:rhodanese-related sulfurtransferase
MQLDAEPDLVMIDVRTPAEFSEVHATRAKNCLAAQVG